MEKLLLLSPISLTGAAVLVYSVSENVLVGGGGVGSRRQECNATGMDGWSGDFERAGSHERMPLVWCAIVGRVWGMQCACNNIKCGPLARCDSGFF